MTLDQVKTYLADSFRLRPFVIGLVIGVVVGLVL